MNLIMLGLGIFNIPNWFCISILLILIFISFSNFESEAKTVDVKIIEHDDNFVRIMFDVYGYVPNDSRLTIKIETTGGQLIKKTFLNLTQKSDDVWGAQILFNKSSPSDSGYNISAFNDAGAFLGRITILLNDPSQLFSPPTSSSTPSYVPRSFGEFILTIDKNLYSYGETIVLTGEVKDTNSGYPVTLIIQSPNGNIASIDQIDVGFDKRFSTKIIAGGLTWTTQGTYTIKGQYGNGTNTIEVSFYFNGNVNTQVISQISGQSINVEGYEIDFEITDGNVNSITTDVDVNSLIMSIDTTDDGLMTILVPRSMLDATFNGQDDDFFVLVDGKEVDFDEIASSSDRLLTIPFPSGADKIEIIGTQLQTSVSQPKTTYHNTFLSLQVQDGTNQGYIKVKPTLTYGSGSKLSTSNISIYVDGNYKTNVASNQLSSNIYAGSGSHTIKASIAEITSFTNNLIKYRASSDTKTFSVKAATSTPTSIPTPTSSNADFPMEYVIVGIVIVGIVIAAVAAVIGIALSKRKKTIPVIAAQPAKVQSAPDETQFWVCPHCGRDTEYRNGKQFCGSCNVYL